MIPIRNVYYMLAYAWNHLQESRTIDLSKIDAQTPEDLLALVLARGTLRLLKRGVDRDYLIRDEALRGLRGRIQVSATVRRALRTRGQIECQFDELSEDIPANRIIASTLRSLLQIGSLSRGIRREVELVVSRFPRVSPLRVSPADFSGVVIHRNNRFYRFLLDVCRLIHENLISDQAASGALRFRDFREDEATMHRLFEDFVRNFLKIEQNEFKVHSPKIEWDVKGADEYSRSLLPEMQTDIVLENADVARIIDTKFYKEPLNRYYDRPKLHSGNLYQIYTYIDRYRAVEDQRDRRVDALLLYAATADHFDVRYEIGSHTVRAATVDLSLQWHDVRDSVLTAATGGLQLVR